MKGPFVGVGVLVWKDKKVLIGKRNGSHGGGSWSFPGGKLETPESIEECAQREVFEETGVVITGMKIVCITNDLYPGAHWVTPFVEAQWVSGTGEVKEPEKFTDVQWVKLSEIPEPKFLSLQNFLKIWKR